MLEEPGVSMEKVAKLEEELLGFLPQPFLKPKGQEVFLEEGDELEKQEFFRKNVSVLEKHEVSLEEEARLQGQEFSIEEAIRREMTRLEEQGVSTNEMEGLENQEVFLEAVARLQEQEASVQEAIRLDDKGISTEEGARLDMQEVFIKDKPTYSQKGEQGKIASKVGEKSFLQEKELGTEEKCLNAEEQEVSMKNVAKLEKELLELLPKPFLKPKGQNVFLELGAKLEKQEPFTKEMSKLEKQEVNLEVEAKLQGQELSIEEAIRQEMTRLEEQGVSTNEMVGLENQEVFLEAVARLQEQEASVQEAIRLEEKGISTKKGTKLDMQEMFRQDKPTYSQKGEQEKRAGKVGEKSGGKELGTEENCLDAEEVKQELHCQGKQTSENRKKLVKSEKWELMLTKGEALVPYNPASVPEDLKKFMCYLCDIFPRVGSANRSELYRHYASTHYNNEIKHDFGFNNFDFAKDMCPDCDILLKRERFIDHMGVKHSMVERYLPEQYHLPEGQYLQNKESSAWLVRSRNANQNKDQAVQKTKKGMKKLINIKDESSTVHSDLRPRYDRKTKSKISQRSSVVQKSSLYHKNGLLLHSSLDLCDCLEDSCPGCHFPCPKCMSPKCGHECRSGRKWQYHSVQPDGVPDSLRLNNHLVPTCQ